ncbi:hypothetical protein GCM10009837_87330 [Streptomyces durmitorensis]
MTAALLLAGGVSAGTATATSSTPHGGSSVMGACPDTGNEVTVPGGKAEWDITCERGKVHVRGHVKDTRMDGKCARVKATNPRNDEKRKKSACGVGTDKSFDWNLGKGSQAKVYLYTS